ncbi:hypothetical protein PanWU01x14_041140, partial [Parasponia andersonii]
MDPKLKLSATDGDLLPDASTYRRLIGRLLSLTLPCPDITFVVHKLSQFLSRPCLPHLLVAHHLLRYLKYLLVEAYFSLQVKAFSDVDWGSCPDTRKSVTPVFASFLVTLWSLGNPRSSPLSLAF